MKIKRVLITMLTALMLFSLISCSSLVPEKNGEIVSEAGRWTAGFSQAALIPPNMDTAIYYMAGYAVDKPITGVLDYQMAKAVWLDDSSGSGGIVIAVVDCIGLTSSEVEKIRGMLADFQAETGCRSVNIISTHTHAGIDTLGLWGPVGVSGRSPEFMQVLYDGVVEAVWQAYNSRRDGRLFYGSVVIEDMLHDSRPPFVYDLALHSLRFEPDSGGNGIRILNYAAHPEALRSRNTLLSADFPAYMSEHIKQISGDDSVYIPAAIGGLIMTQRQRGEDGEFLPDIESTVITGQRIGEAAINISNETELEPNISIYHKEAVIPLDNDLYVLYAFLGILDSKTVSHGGRHSMSIITEVGLLTLGGLPVFLIPGELFPELAYGGASTNSEMNPPTLADIAGMDFLMFGLCNDMIGYIVPPGDFVIHETHPYFERGVGEDGKRHYEETNSVGPLAAEIIIGALAELFAVSAINQSQRIK